jgi:hypothetical protein
MLISSMVVMTIPATAEEVEADAYVAPEIPTKGETDVWNKTTVTEPTQVDADGYILITSAAEFVYMMKNNLTGDVNNYRLTVNVDLNRGIPAGNKDIGGILDGDGHFVSNFSRNAYSNYFAFNVVSGTIRNLNFKDINIQTQNSRGALISSLTG